MSDRHVVRYTTQSDDRYLQTGPISWDEAQMIWYALDEARREGKLDWVKFFEVRSADDPTNPTVKVPTRTFQRSDHPDNLRLKSVKLVEDQRVYTFQCISCGRAFQGSGLGLGSHRNSAGHLQGWERSLQVRRERRAAQRASS